MKIFAIIIAVLTGATGPRVWERTQASTDLQALSASDGVSLSEADGIRVSVTAQTGTITGGKVCAFYYQPSVDGGTAQWVRNGNLDLTITAPTLPDGGTTGAVVLPDLAVLNQYGKVAFLTCGVTGTATSMTVRVESFGKSFP